MANERELVATVRGAMIIRILYAANERPVPVAILAEKTGVSYKYMLDEVITKLEIEFPLIRHKEKPYSVSLPRRT